MTDYSTDARTYSSTSRTITGFFDTRDAAVHATQALNVAGIGGDDVSLVEGHGETGAYGEHRGFWDKLKDFFLPDEDRYSYAEGLRRGGFVLTVHTTEERADTVFDILEQYGSVDMDAREASWRAEGWGGWVPGSMDDSIALPREQRVPPQVNPAESEAHIRAPLGELPRFGRRDVDHGRLTARSYVYDDF
jgi:hypothetical protein